MGAGLKRFLQKEASVHPKRKGLLSIECVEKEAMWIACQGSVPDF